ncbi:SDR family oxidoreductase [Pannonibacter tanglangensis]|uniref:SDR family oxidoreductase n=1 Tax=Pannonibacter tanglangensis TaxID=2750084 RepID=A0ABW9ZH78_9HYPH|nr:SDR family oxidoreductase [Pannonibacter sp. XCT-34]NBN64210.1 SDR family oxidoreductase [Pannonibacter sp. XCT-34]
MPLDLSGSSPALASFPGGGLAVIIGASGAIGAEIARQADASGRFARVLRLARRPGAGDLVLDLTDEATIAAAAAAIGATGLPLRFAFDATGMLHDGAIQPEKSWRQLDALAMARSFAINAIGPALLMKHLLPLLAGDGKAVFATLSARVGSIGDNELGGWYSYRAAKAALNQLVRSAAIELARKRPAAACVVLHPGTVASRLSDPFAKAGLTVRPPEEAAARLLTVVDALEGRHTGSFHDAEGKEIVW